MKINTTYSLITLCIISFSSHALTVCDPILEQGVYNTYKEVNKQAFKNKVVNEFCSSSSTSGGDSSSGGGGLSLNIGGWGIGLNGSGSRNQVNQKRNEVCNSNQSSLSDDGYHTVLTMIADPNIISAWTQCNKSQGGVIINGDVRESPQVDISVKFTNINNTYWAKITSVQIKGLVCPPDYLRVGEQIDGNEKVFSCDRIGDEPITININTDVMGQRLYIPKPKQIAYVPEPQPNCESTIQPGGVVLGPTDPRCNQNSPFKAPPPPAPVPFNTGRTN